MGFLIPFLLKLISTELTKTVIGYGINKLLESKDDGITKDIAMVKGDTVDMQEYIDKCLAVKAKYPK